MKELTPERVGDGLRLKAGHQALAGLHQQLERPRAQHRALRARCARRLQLGQAVQRSRHIDLVKGVDPLAHLLQHLLPQRESASAGKPQVLQQLHAMDVRGARLYRRCCQAGVYWAAQAAAAHIPHPIGATHIWKMP